MYLGETNMTLKWVSDQLSQILVCLKTAEFLVLLSWFWELNYNMLFRTPRMWGEVTDRDDSLG